MKQRANVLNSLIGNTGSNLQVGTALIHKLIATVLVLMCLVFQQQIAAKSTQKK